ncbi:MAG: efflux RND transporter permease subunit [Thioalkalivibrionaceae bacterium]
MADQHHADSGADHSSSGNNSKHEGLGLAGSMAKAFIHSPLSPLLLIASIAIGILGLIVTPRQEDPQISVPMIDIFVEAPGLPAEQMANLVSRPLERLMSEISGVDNVYSASHRGHAMVTVQFDVGENMESSVVKVHDRLMANRDLMPPGVSEPLVKPKGVDDVPVVTLTFWSHTVDDALLRQIALEAQQLLGEVPNTAQSFVVSGRDEQLRIEIRPERLVTYGVSFDDVARAVQASNSEAAVGRLELGGRTVPVQAGAFIRGVDDAMNLLVGVRGGQPIYLSDVADVIDGPGEVDRFVRYYTGVAGLTPEAAPDGAAAVTLAIAKKPGSNGVSVANGILERLEHLQGQLIPEDVSVAVTRNYGESANDKVNELIFKLFIATGAVTLLVWLFLGIRAAVVVLIVIPVVLLFTVFSAWLLDYTIDRVSLFALIFAIGILVDDAIVVVENIYRRWLMKGEVDTETTVDAVREVGNPTILATFTVIAALLPMGFVSGMMGPYMQPIPALGSVAMLFSLVAAFVFTPWLTMRLKPTFDYLDRMTEKEHRQAENLGHFFRRAIPSLANDRKRGFTFLAIILVAFFGFSMLFVTKDVRVKMLPLDNKPVFNVVINFPEGTALTETATAAHEMASVVRTFPEVTAVQAYVGTASPFDFNGLVRHYYLRQEPWQADLHVQVLDKGDRRRTSHEIAVEARDRLTPIAESFGARIQVVEMPPGPPVLQSVVAEVYGPDAATRRQVARDLEAMFTNAEHLGDVDTMMQAPHDVWHFEIDRDKALRRGVTVESINQTLAAALQGKVLGDVRARSRVEPQRIVLRLPEHLRSELDQVLLLPVSTPDGGSMLLTELGQFEMRAAEEPIFHKNLRPVEYVTGETIGRLAAPVYGMLEVQSQLADYRAPDGSEVRASWIGPPPNDGRVAFEWAGEWTVTYETFRDMGIAFAVALVLIYMLVVWEFGNFILPGIIMAPIPLTLIGIIPGHWLLNAEFTATSMIGFIALAGIIVRNSILLVDFARQEVGRGRDVQEAMIMACQARTRPILITALALLAGSSVILFDPIFQGMAISLMFGTVVATALTLLVIPLGCISGRRAFCPATLNANGERGPLCGIAPIGGKAELVFPMAPVDTVTVGSGAIGGGHVHGSTPAGVSGGYRSTSKERVTPSLILAMLWQYLVALIVSISIGLRDFVLAVGRMLFRRDRRSSGPDRGPNAPPRGPGGSARGGGNGGAGPGSRGTNAEAGSGSHGGGSKATQRGSSDPAQDSVGVNQGAAPRVVRTDQTLQPSNPSMVDRPTLESRAGSESPSPSTTSEPADTASLMTDVSAHSFSPNRSDTKPQASSKGGQCVDPSEVANLLGQRADRDKVAGTSESAPGVDTVSTRSSERSDERGLRDGAEVAVNEESAQKQTRVVPEPADAKAETSSKPAMNRPRRKKASTAKARSDGVSSGKAGARGRRGIRLK